MPHGVGAQRMVIRQKAACERRRHKRNTVLLDQPTKSRLAERPANVLSDDQQRTLRVANQTPALPNRLVISRRRWRHTRHARGAGTGHRGVEHIFWKVEVHRSWPPAHRAFIRAQNGGHDLGDPLHRGCPFRDALKYWNGVELLEIPDSFGVDRTPAADHDDRPAVVACHHDARQRIGHRGSGGNHDSGLEPPGYVVGRRSHQHRGVLMARADGTDAMSGTRGKDAVNRCSCNPHHPRDATLMQSFRDQHTAGALSRGIPKT